MPAVLPDDTASKILSSLDRESVVDFLTHIPESKRAKWVAVFKLWLGGDRMPAGTMDGLDVGQVLGMALRDYLGKRKGDSAPSESHLFSFVVNAAKMMRNAPVAPPQSAANVSRETLALAKRFADAALTHAVFDADRMSEPVIRGRALSAVALACERDVEWVIGVLGRIDYPDAATERGDALARRIASAIPATEP